MAIQDDSVDSTTRGTVTPHAAMHDSRKLRVNGKKIERKRKMYSWGVLAAHTFP